MDVPSVRGLAAAPAPLPAARRRFQRALHRWYAASARPLPWRTAPSLYRTVVSEFMLQQTQIKTALPFFDRWMLALPDFGALAAADEARVLKLWEGLGYYSRARNLHRLGRAMAARPSAPRSAAEWEEMPGVGPYTAAAISSLAFGERAAVVDGNVVRVLARLTADANEFRGGSEAARHFTPLAGALIEGADPGTHNQAVMELGALVCTPRNPRCPECPVRAHCEAFAAGRPEEFPRLVRPKAEQRTITRIWQLRRDALLLHRIPAASRRLAGQHELPTGDQLGLTDADTARGRLIAIRRRSITRFQINERIVALPAVRTKPGPDLVWVPLAELDAITLSGPHRRWVREILEIALAREE